MKERQTLDEPRINRDPTVRRIPGGRSRTSGATHLEATPTASPSTKTSLCPKAEPQRLDHLGRPSLQSIFRPQVFDGRALKALEPLPAGTAAHCRPQAIGGFTNLRELSHLNAETTWPHASNTAGDSPRKRAHPQAIPHLPRKPLDVATQTGIKSFKHRFMCGTSLDARKPCSPKNGTD